MGEYYLAQIIQFAGNFAIRGTAMCNGQILSIAQNSAVFSLMGTTYGGNGVTTFALPNLQGRMAMHWGQGPGLPVYDYGEQGGSPSTTLLSSNLPATAINVPCTSGQATSANPVGNIPAGPVNPADGSAFDGYSPTSAANGNLGGVFLAGGGQPFNIMPPYLCVTWLIVMEGIFPSRN
jgi:microcystin-dependent protein